MKPCSQRPALLRELYLPRNLGEGEHKASLWGALCHVTAGNDGVNTLRVAAPQKGRSFVSFTTRFGCLQCFGFHNHCAWLGHSSLQRDVLLSLRIFLLSVLVFLILAHKSYESLPCDRGARTILGQGNSTFELITLTESNLENRWSEGIVTNPPWST